MPIVRDAERLADSGSLKEALAKLDEARKKAPREHRVLLIKAKMLESANNFREAQECAAEAHRLAPNDVGSILVLMRYGRDSLSQSELEALGWQAISLKLDSGQAHYLLGVALARSDDTTKLKQAIAEFQKSYELNPRQASSLIDTAKIHSRLGNHPAATVFLERAAAQLDVQPPGTTVVRLEDWISQRREAAFWLAQEYRRSGDAAKAAGAAKLATQLSDHAREIRTLRDRAASQPPDIAAKKQLAQLAEHGMSYWKNP